MLTFNQSQTEKQELFTINEVSDLDYACRAANLVRPKKGIMMAKKRNFKQKKGIHKNKTYNHARHTSNAEMLIHHAVFSIQGGIFV